MMTQEEFFDRITHIVDDARTPDQSKEWCDVFFQAIQEYYRLKCLEAIRNTRHKAIEIVQDESYHTGAGFAECNVEDTIKRIQNIPNQEVIPEL